MNFDNSEKKTNPVHVFFLAYTIYNLLGLFDYPWLISDLYDKTTPWLAFLAGFAGLSIGVIFWGLVRVFPPRRQVKPIRGKLLGSFFFIVFIFCLVGTVIKSRGVPLFLGEGRFENSAMLFNLAQLYGFWVVFQLISSCESGKKPSVTPIIIYFIGVLFFGYRSPVIILMLTVFIYFTCFKFSRRKSYKIYAVGGVISVTLFSMMAGYRVSQDYDPDTFFKNVDMGYIHDHTYIAPLVPALSMFDFSQKTISVAAENIDGHMYGDLLLSNYKAFLPGSHWGARNIVGDLIGARWINDRPMSITPTLQGALFIDFGLVGVFLGLFIISGIIALLKKHADSSGPLSKLTFCYVTTMSLMSIHNGYWDITFIFFFMFLLSICVYRTIARSQSLPVAN